MISGKCNMPVFMETDGRDELIYFRDIKCSCFIHSAI